MTSPTPNIDALMRAGLLAAQARAYAQAEAHFIQVLRAQPDNAQAAYNLAYVMNAQGRVAEAEQLLRAIVAKVPRHFHALVTLGNILAETERWDEAVPICRRALRIEDIPGVRYNLARALRALGDPVEAVKHARLAVRRQPDWVDAHWVLARAACQSGAWDEGMREYEWRFHADPGRPMPEAGIPRWDGKERAGRLLVRWEQGLGDTIQFSRYLTLARERADWVALECQPRLAAILEGVAGADEVIASEAADPPSGEWTHQVPLMSLPHLLGRPEPWAPAEPYLKRPLPSTGLPERPGKRIGLVWRGNPNHAQDRLRSVPGECLAALCELPGLSFISLQLGEAMPHPSVFDATALVSDWPGTAAVVASLDLVISIDSAIAHLAGALGVPTWLLLPVAADWRWGPVPTSTGWYPSHRLFRQAHGEGWAKVIDRVAADLRPL